MALTEGLLFLARLIPKYNKMDSAGYVLSRLSKAMPRKCVLEALFCRSCLVLYIPAVNCRTRYDEHGFRVQCNGCGKDTVLDSDTVSACFVRDPGVDPYSFESYFRD
jgi:hypothetical protein